ncbi:RDD family protein [Pyruvatibacter mobilis]|uniref:RDD family protein n=1 Tax=Pyruvatibacter mobilis TaxID=1712261 RepID=A0A845QCS2_9HYPH|nr:RDD family protein [Pyruvatibacter mobilis]NBG95811.1 RDD family protein [Pyruvatibacter mobilis]QJD74952.1 RDD family protein [Pyruvatibacter mobilis]GGD11470.1 RDD family protein [Pyruvatibacter mobilis]
MAALDRPDGVHWREAKGDDPIHIDADRYPELFEGVLGKRVIAFLVDWALLAVATVFLTIILAILGIFTLGLLWPLISPLAALMWLGYFAVTIGGPTSATPGMRFTGIEVRTWDGARPGMVQGALQSLLFWLSWTVTVFVVLVPLFNQRRRCLHDYLIGTIVINTPDQIPPDARVISG